MANNGLRVGSVTPRLFQTLTITPGAVGAADTLIETYTLNGLMTDMMVRVSQQVTQVHVALVHARCSAANTLEITWINPTATPVTPTAGQFIDVIAV